MSDPPRPWWRPRLDGLAPRVAAFLTIALLPLGLIALWQTREFQQESERRAELTLLALTEQGAAGVGSAVERALGAGEALSILADLLDDPESCSRYLQRFVGGDNAFDFVGLLPADGPVTCSSLGDPFDLDASVRAELSEMLVERRIVVRASASQDDVLVVGLPLLTADDGAGEAPLPGYLALTIPRNRLHSTAIGPPALMPERLVTFNGRGQVLTGGEAPLDGLLPEGQALVDLATEAPRIFAAPNAQGEERVYTSTPLIPGLAYALAVWSPEQAGREIGDGIAGSPLLFPLLMWAVSLIVAFWAIHGLMIRRVTELGQRMRRFGRDRSLLDRISGPSAPYELREIEDAFRTMAGSVLQDEARMENAFRERGVLLREVHHRVKNNLQLISSIISMQVRRMPEPRTRAILRRLQDRVLTLASIYRSLYTSPDLGDVNAAPVVRAIVEQELRNATDRVEAMLDIEDMVLDPDKVVPLSFLAAEAVSNALARARAVDGAPSLSVTLHREGETATLRIVNSLDGPPPSEEEVQQGLGRHLIQAFAAQVGGPVEIQLDDRLYALAVTFPVATQHAETEDA